MKKKLLYLFLLISGLFIVNISITAQTLKGVVKSTVNHISGFSLEGTWRYEGAAVNFQSDNLLKKAGGMVAASSIEKSVNEQLEKIGFQSGVTSFTFNSDSTFTNLTNGKSISGKYSYDSQTKYITLKYVNHIPIKAKVSGTPSKMSLLFEASGFLSMVTFLGSHTGVSAINSISSILKSYDGMMVGLELKKE